ncbi:WD40 repeat-like protein [Sanghuangporus baumii]|uniref:WD40 repeat-like protein n=1 Tax=Sanghuangporus baumii TaxID=108892 RepID=A0A9Q5I3X0_SANBA|nr:WD40 repeat-like protein [Sanghuangporus baumii]
MIIPPPNDLVEFHPSILSVGVQKQAKSSIWTDHRHLWNMRPRWKFFGRSARALVCTNFSQPAAQSAPSTLGKYLHRFLQIRMRVLPSSLTFSVEDDLDASAEGTYSEHELSEAGRSADASGIGAFEYVLAKVRKYEQELGADNDWLADDALGLPPLAGTNTDGFTANKANTCRPPPTSASHDSSDDFIHIQNIKASLEERKKKGTFFLILRADDGRTFKSSKYMEGEEIEWAIEDVCLVQRRFFLPNKKTVFLDFDVKELRVNTIFDIPPVGSSRARVTVESKGYGPFVDIIRRLLEESQQRLSTMKVFLEKLGKACEVLNRITRYVEPMADIHPAVSAVVSAVTLLRDLLGDRMGEINSYREEFGKLKETFQWCIRVETWKTALKIDPRTEHLVLSQLHPALNAFYDAEKSCLENTRKDVFLRIKEWSFRGPVLFWLYGVEGTGKTTMCHTVARSLDEEDRLAACFFWDKNDRDRRQAERFLPTLSYQLAKWRLGSQFELLFRNPFSKLGQSKFSESRPPRERHLVIVLDGLDESCDSIPARRALAGFVREISTLVPWLKVFVSSRRPPELEDCFAFDGSSHLGLDYPSYDLRGEIKELVAQSSIEQKADGNSFACDKLYRRFINNVIDSQRHDVDMMPLVRNVLGVASCSALNRPLTENALIHFLEPFHPELTASAFHDSTTSLKPILFVNAEGTLHLIFPLKSFLAFMSNRYRSGWISVDIGSVNVTIARRCLDTMRTGLKFNMCDLESSYLENKAISDLACRVKENIPESLQYSYSYWMEHIAQGRDGRVLQGFVVDLLSSTRFLYWIEVLSLPSALESGKDMLLKCREMLQLRSDNPEIITAAIELSAFLDDFHHAVKTSTPHIYVSALSWRIENSFIHKRLGSDFRCHFPLLSEDSALSTEARDTFWVVRDTKQDWNAVRFANVVTHSPKKRIASGREDGTIRIWDAQTGTPIGSPKKGHKSFVRAVAYSPDGTKLMSGSDDGVLRIWDADSLDALGEPLKVDAGYISALQFSPGGMRVASAGAALRIWDAQSGGTVGESRSITAGNKRYIINCLRYSADGSKVVCGLP